MTLDLPQQGLLTEMRGTEATLVRIRSWTLGRCPRCRRVDERGCAYVLFKDGGAFGAVECEACGIVWGKVFDPRVPERRPRRVLSVMLVSVG